MFYGFKSLFWRYAAVCHVLSSLDGIVWRIVRKTVLMFSTWKSNMLIFSRTGHVRVISVVQRAQIFTCRSKSIEAAPKLLSLCSNSNNAGQNYSNASRDMFCRTPWMSVRVNDRHICRPSMDCRTVPSRVDTRVTDEMFAELEKYLVMSSMMELNFSISPSHSQHSVVALSLLAAQFK